jgi:hypothetical protein
MKDVSFSDFKLPSHYAYYWKGKKMFDQNKFTKGCKNWRHQYFEIVLGRYFVSCKSLIIPLNTKLIPNIRFWQKQIQKINIINRNQFSFFSCNPFNFFFSLFLLLKIHFSGKLLLFHYWTLQSFSYKSYILLTNQKIIVNSNSGFESI